jgi:hypothetical protein
MPDWSAAKAVEAAIKMIPAIVAIRMIFLLFRRSRFYPMQRSIPLRLEREVGLLEFVALGILAARHLALNRAFGSADLLCRVGRIAGGKSTFWRLDFRLPP